MNFTSRQHKILVVDDDPDILTILRDNLELDGYTTVAAGSGKEALSIFKADLFNLVVLDLMLPDIDGIQVCRALRSMSQVPIIMLTAKDGISDKVLGLESGADDYLVKPFDYLELAARIRARLRRSNTYHPLDSSHNSFRTGELELNLEDRQVVLGGRPVTLTRKEFEILALLFQHLGQAVTRDMIRKAIWSDTSLYKWSRTIDVHIQHLRAKLEQDQDLPRYIITIQGVGYKLQCPPG